jgi:hypothetical protein
VFLIAREDADYSLGADVLRRIFTLLQRHCREGRGEITDTVREGIDRSAWDFERLAELADVIRPLVRGMTARWFYVRVYSGVRLRGKSIP